MEYSSPPLKVFISYSHKDQLAKQRIHEFLVRRFSDIEILSDHKLAKGTDWNSELVNMRNEAQVFLLLISPSYLYSEQVKREVGHIMQRAEQEGKYVIPIILEQTDWHQQPYNIYSSVPRSGQSLNHFDIADEPLTELVILLESIRQFLSNRKALQLISLEKQSRSGVLNLADCNLQSIPRDLLEMPWLETLRLDKNYIKEIDHLDNLQFLTTLSIVSNEITVPNHLEHLERLVSLDMMRNQLITVEPLAANRDLVTLGVSSNRLTSLKGVERLEQLKTLYAAHNNLTSIAELEHLPHLKRVVLTDNHIRSIRPMLGHIHRGMKVFLKYSFDPDEDGLFLRDNVSSLAEPSVEVIEKGTDAITKYFSHAEQYGTRKLEIMKLILVGNSGVGKTNFSEFLRKKALTPKHNSTHLLDIQPLDASFLVSERGEPMRVNIFDFGGQDYYHDSHRMYYSHDTAYVLLWDSQTNQYSEQKDTSSDGEEKEVIYENYPIEYWLESIHYNLADKYRHNYNTQGNSTTGTPKPSLNTSPVLVLQNKIDVGEGMLDQKALSEKYPSISGYFSMSLTSNKRTQVLDQILSDFLTALNLSGRQLIEYEYRVIENFRQYPRDFNVLSLNDFHQECLTIINNPSVPFTLENAEIIAQILNAIGMVYFDKTGPNEGFIFTDIRRLNEIIKQIMLVAKQGNDKGIVRAQQLNSIPYVDKVLSLLTKNRSIIKLNDEQYVVAQFLPVQPDPSIAFFLHAFTFNQVRFVYKAYFHKTLLLAVFSKYVSSTISGSNISLSHLPFWRNGIFVTKGEGENRQMVFVEFVKTPTCGIINIKSMRPYNKKALEREIEQTFDELNKGWTVSKQVSVDSQNFFDITYLKEEVKNLHYDFVANGKTFSVNDFKHIVDFEKLPKKLFISYSSKNAEFIKRFVTHLEVLKSSGLIEPWYDRMIESGTKWDDTIRNEMKNSDVVIFLLSPDFLATEYIMKTELPLAIEQMGDDHSKFYFIELQPCGWKRTEISRFQQTDDKNIQEKNIISIRRPDNDAAWNRVIDDLVEKINSKTI